MKDYSIAIFGSSLRGDFDCYSDKDLLIVSNDKDKLKELTDEYGKNWSISSYSYSKLEFIAKKGGLFIDHLKDESMILVDQNERLDQILSSYRRKSTYKREYLESIEFLNELNVAVDTPILLAWYCDVIAVGLRNALIFESSLHGSPAYSFKKLIQSLVDRKKITKSEANTLNELRVLKRNYRDSIDVEYPDKDYVICLIEVLNKLNLIQDFKFTSISDFRANSISKMRDNRLENYLRMRFFEGYYRSFLRMNSRVEKIVSLPQFYSFKFSDMAYIDELVHELQNMINMDAPNSQNQRSELCTKEHSR